MASLSSSKWLSSSPHKRKQEDKGGGGGGGGGGGDCSGANARPTTATTMANDRVQRWIVVGLLCLWSASIPFRYSYGTTSTRMIRTTTTLTQSPPPTTTTTPSSSGGSLSSWITPPPLLSPFPNHHNDNHNWLVWVTLTRRQPTQFPLLVRTAQALLAVPPSTSNINRNNHTSTNVYWLVVELPPLPQPDDNGKGNDNGNLGRPRHHQKKKKKKRQQRQPKQEKTNHQHQKQHSHSPLDDSEGGGCTAAVRDYVHETLSPPVQPYDDHPPQPRLAWAHMCWKDLVDQYYHHSPPSDATSLDPRSSTTNPTTAATRTMTAMDVLPRAIADLVQRHVVLPSLPASSSSRSNPTTTTMVQVVYSHAGTLPLLLHVGRLHRFLVSGEEYAAPTSRRRILACPQQEQVIISPRLDGSTTTTNNVTITLNTWLPPSWCPTKNHTHGPQGGCRNRSSSINTTTSHPERQQPEEQHERFFLPWRLEVTPGYLENVQGELWNLEATPEHQDEEAPFEPSKQIQTPEQRRLVMMQRRAQWNRRQLPPFIAAVVGDASSSANESWSSPLSPLFWEPPWDMLQVLPSLEGISNYPEGRNA